MTRPTVAGLLFLLVGAVASAGERVPLTRDVVDRFDDDELRGLQVYAAQRIVLERELASGEEVIAETHEIRATQDRTIETVVIEKGTPGVILDVGPGKELGLSFEPQVDGEDLFLVFTPRSPCQAHPRDRRDLRGQYSLATYREVPLCDVEVPEWSFTRKRLTTMTGFEVEYGARRYRVSHSVVGTLAVDRSEVEKVERRTRQAPGRRVEGEPSPSPAGDSPP